MKLDRVALVAAWLLVTGGLAILVGQLKPLPQGLMVLAPLLPWVMPQRARPACVVGLLVVGFALLGFGAGFSLATTLLPARTGDGHAVMPVGQLMFGGPLGAVAAIAVAWKVRPKTGETQRHAMRAAAVTSAVLAVVVAWDRLN
jgi:hypothetical protein